MFVGRAEERKGLPTLLSAFTALYHHVPVRLVVVGVDEEELEPYITDPEVTEAIEARGRRLRGRAVALPS